MNRYHRVITLLFVIVFTVSLSTTAYSQDVAPETLIEISWSNDGSRFAAGQIDGTITLWDANEERLLLTLKGHTDLITDLEWSPDDTRLLSTSYDFSARIWDTENGELQYSLPHDNFVLSGIWLQSTHILTGAASGIESLKVWEIAKEPTVVRSADAGTVTQIALSPDQRKLAIASAAGYVSVYSVDSLARI